jgi:phosphatidylserine/phosphatidylglycerophosphate/cardiolipin synthase-like enzyme
MKGRPALLLGVAGPLLVGMVALLAVTAAAGSAGKARDVASPTATKPGPLVLSNGTTSPLLIEALYYDGHAAYDYDEAVRITNVSTATVDVGGWALAKGSATTQATFPAGTLLAPGEAVWCTYRATAFAQHFGFPPDFETYGTDPTVAQMGGSWPRYANEGGECLLKDASGAVVDVLVYEEGETGTAGWLGPAVWPWSPNTYFGAEGQILYRKREQRSGLVWPDSDGAADWAQDPTDQVDGRKARYPGWDLDPFFWTARVTETAALTVAVGPDHLLPVVLAELDRAQESLVIQSYTFESGPLAQRLLDKLAEGVEVTLLLEGSPAGGMASAQRWIAGQIHGAGGQVWFLSSEVVPTRYRYQHAKCLLVDGRRVLIGTENLNPTGMPADDKGDGTAGRRGIYLVTDAPGVVERVAAVLAADQDPAHHLDLVGCEEAPALCSGVPPGAEPNWTTYTVAFSQPLAIRGEMTFEVVQAPENSLRTEDSLLGLVGRAGAEDTVLVEQFYEAPDWGPAGGTPQTDPNLRLEAYLDAARRGARVRILLNAYLFGQTENENEETAAYLRARARAEGLDLEVRLANPTALGLHNKMVLVQADGRGYLHVGSLNGSEVSSKVNREMALQVQSDAAYGYLRAVFEHDWRTVRLAAYLPLVFKGYAPPQPADHLLVSEVLYAVSREEEWVEILNPTAAPVDLSAYRLGDAQEAGVYEGMYRFPAGTTLGPREVLVVAASAEAFGEAYGFAPDFEFYATDVTVPTLERDDDWGAGEWWLRDDGDQVLLLDGGYGVVDVVAYGDAAYPGVVPHPGVSFYTHSLERDPPRFDTDDCSVDFRDWAFPNPGEVPEG